MTINLCDALVKLTNKLNPCQQISIWRSPSPENTIEVIISEMKFSGTVSVKKVFTLEVLVSTKFDVVEHEIDKMLEELKHAER